MVVASYIAKYAVDYKQLSKAYDKLVRPRLMRQTGISSHTGGLLEGLVTKGVQRKGWLPGTGMAISYPKVRQAHKLSGSKSGLPSRKALRGTARSQGVIVARGTPLKWLYGTETSPSSRRIIGKTTGLHEAEELASGAARGKKNLFAGHIGTSPVLQDLNIAATITGKGSDEASRILRRSRKLELESIHEFAPEVKRLSLGKERINRRIKKHIESRFNRHVEGMMDNL